jgi:hypothetical protein
MSAKRLTQPLLLRGSLITLSRRCGKTNCHCKDGEPHTTPALSYSLNGKTFILTLRAKDIPEVKEALRSYRRAQRQLDRQALQGIRALSARIRHEKQTRRVPS